jgi:hypothetical protein
MTSDKALEIVQTIRVKPLFNNRLPITVSALSVVPNLYINIQIWVADVSRMVYIDIVGKGERELIQEIFDHCLRILTTELHENFR